MKHRDEKIVFQGKIVEVVQYPVQANGQESIFEKARRSPGVRVLIETPSGGFILNKEKRHELGLKEDWRLPGGKVFDSLASYNEFLAGQKDEKEIIEKAKEAAIKEAVEETGLEPVEIEFLTISTCGTTMEWDLYYFVVRKYKEVKRDLKETEALEILETKEFSKEELKNLALSGAMQEDRSVAVILKYLNGK